MSISPHLMCVLRLFSLVFANCIISGMSLTNKSILIPKQRSPPPRMLIIHLFSVVKIHTHRWRLSAHSEPIFAWGTCCQCKHCFYLQIINHKFSLCVHDHNISYILFVLIFDSCICAARFLFYGVMVLMRCRFLLGWDSLPVVIDV